MLFVYVVFAPLLVALAIGAFLFIWAEKKDSAFGKVVGGFITVLAILLLIMQAWQSSKMWREGVMIKKEMQKMMRQMPEKTPEKK